MPRLLIALCLVALTALGCDSDPKEPGLWERTLQKTRRPSDRVRIVESLRDSGNLNPGFLTFLHQQLATEKSPEVKGALARAIATVGDKRSAKPLADAVDLAPQDSATHGMNKEIAQALGQLGDPMAVPTLVRLLKGKDNYTRVAAADALGALKAREAVEPLVEIAGDETAEPFVTKKAVEALGRIGDARAVPALVKLLTYERRSVSFYPESSFALFQLGRPASDALLPVLEGKDLDLIKWAQTKRINPASFYMKAAQVLGDLRERRAEGALLERLTFTDQDARIQAVVRLQAAEALARMRSRAAIKPIATMVETPYADVRQAYVRDLVLLGGRDALPQLARAAATGSFEARLAAAEGLAALGDARELPVLDKLVKGEPQATLAECRKEPVDGCEQPAALASRRSARLAALKARLEAASACGADGACWEKRLASDPDRGVRERAAFELGRAGNPGALAALAARLGEKDVYVRGAAIQAVDWLAEDSQEARKAARASVGDWQKQLTQERGRTDYLRVNEDLRRLVTRLQQPDA